MISADSHRTDHLTFMKYGVLAARRAWLEKEDVLNTLLLSQFFAALWPKPHSQKAKVAQGRLSRVAEQDIVQTAATQYFSLETKPKRCHTQL